jgi:RluA family pseudouridine synthase
VTIKLSSPTTREHWEVRVLFEDAWLLVLDKPSALLVSPDRYDADRPNLMKLLHRDIARRSAWVHERRDITYLANAHRLDFETSGALVLAKDKNTLTQLVNLFGSEKVSKTYVALVHGQAAGPQQIDAPIGMHPAKIGYMRVDMKRGKRASTRTEISQRFGRYTLLRCHPATGRTHQIRVHLRHAGWPIVGDTLYGGPGLYLSQLKPGYRFKPRQAEKPLLGRVALHAEQIAFEHPVTGQPLVITAPWPKDLSSAIKYLQRYDPAPEASV